MGDFRSVTLSNPLPRIVVVKNIGGRRSVKYVFHLQFVYKNNKVGISINKFEYSAYFFPGFISHWSTSQDHFKKQNLQFNFRYSLKQNIFQI